MNINTLDDAKLAKGLLAPDPDALLLVLPVPYRTGPDGQLLVEKQAANGLDRWADNFLRVIVAAPLYLDGLNQRGSSSAEYVSIDTIKARDRIEFVPLPWAFRLLDFLKHYRSTRLELGRLIARCQYLSFAIGGLVGDWASVAAIEAYARGREYSVWTDRVEHRVVRLESASPRGLRGWYRWVKVNLLVAPLMRRYERHVISNSKLGLFHGRDCYDAYLPYCQTSHLVHNVHLKPEDRITSEQLNDKARRLKTAIPYLVHDIHLTPQDGIPVSDLEVKSCQVLSFSPLHLMYAGRAAAMKGPRDWLAVLTGLRDRGVKFTATWLGDGPMLDEMREEVARCGLGAVVRLPGYVGDKNELLKALRAAHLFVFCHLTPESPRCLLEALVSGTPIVGYDSPFPRDLLGDRADHLLVPRGDTAALTDRLAALSVDRRLLGSTLLWAAQISAVYNDAAVFLHRSELIKKYLTPTSDC